MRLSPVIALAAALVVGCVDGSEPPSTEPAPDEAVLDAAPTAWADDPETLGGEMPTYAERLLSGPYVEVSYVALPPGASVALANGESWVVYAVSDAELEVGGDPARWSGGTAAFYDARTRVTNAGSGDAQLLFFERWANPLPDRREAPDVDVRFPVEMMRLDEIDSPAVEVLVSNDRVGVAHVTLAPGERLPPHSAFSRAVVALSDYEAERSRGEEFGGASPDVRVQRKAGSVTWDTARNYAVENVGDTPSETLVVAYYE